MGDRKKSRGLLRAFRSASDSNPATDPPRDLASIQSNSGSRPEQSPAEQSSQQAALSPPTPSRSRRFLNRLGWISSPSSLPRSPSTGVEPRNSTTDHHVTTSAPSPDGYGSPFCPGYQASSFTSAIAPTGSPIIRVSHPPPPESITTESSAPSPICTPSHNRQAQAQAITNARKVELPADPEAIEPRSPKTPQIIELTEQTQGILQPPIISY